MDTKLWELQDIDDTIHALLSCSVGESLATRIFLDFLHGLLIENFGGVPGPVDSRIRRPKLQSASSKEGRFNGTAGIR